jgi:UDPglucose--hexose-1-phosphate uridylyltransferase
VVVFAQDASASLGQLPLSRIALIFAVWAERTEDMRRAGIRYVLPFENRGTEMGVTLHHPHGQIYGYGFVPQQQQRMKAALADHHARTGTDLVTALAQDESARATRVIAARDAALAFAPPFARFPYETWIVPRRSVPYLSGLTTEERMDLASALSETLRRLDGLWNRPMPYLMTINQAPLDGETHPEWTVRIEIWPIRRDPNKLKFLAGTELGAGVFASDVTPESAAAALRQVTL